MKDYGHSVPPGIALNVRGCKTTHSQTIPGGNGLQRNCLLALIQPKRSSPARINTRKGRQGIGNKLTVQCQHSLYGKKEINFDQDEASTAELSHLSELGLIHNADNGWPQPLPTPQHETQDCSPVSNSRKEDTHENITNCASFSRIKSEKQVDWSARENFGGCHPFKVSTRRSEKGNISGGYKPPPHGGRANSQIVFVANDDGDDMFQLDNDDIEEPEMNQFTNLEMKHSLLKERTIPSLDSPGPQASPVARSSTFSPSSLKKHRNLNKCRDINGVNKKSIIHAEALDNCSSNLVSTIYSRASHSKQYTRRSFSSKGEIQREGFSSDTLTQSRKETSNGSIKKNSNTEECLKSLDFNNTHHTLSSRVGTDKYIADIGYNGNGTINPTRKTELKSNSFYPAPPTSKTHNKRNLRDSIRYKIFLKHLLDDLDKANNKASNVNHLNGEDGNLVFGTKDDIRAYVLSDEKEREAHQNFSYRNMHHNKMRSINNTSRSNQVSLPINSLIDDLSESIETEEETYIGDRSDPFNINLMFDELGLDDSVLSKNKKNSKSFNFDQRYKRNENPHYGGSEIHSDDYEDTLDDAEFYLTLPNPYDRQNNNKLQEFTNLQTFLKQADVCSDRFSTDSRRDSLANDRMMSIQHDAGCMYQRHHQSPINSRNIGPQSRNNNNYKSMRGSVKRKTNRNETCSKYGVTDILNDENFDNLHALNKMVINPKFSTKTPCTSQLIMSDLEKIKLSRKSPQSIAEF